MSSLPSGAWRKTVVVVISPVIFASLALLHIRLPGLYYDEVIQATPALRAVLGDPAIHSFGFGRSVGIGQHRLFLMTMGYIGAVKSALFVPVIAVFGSGVVPIRCTTIMIGVMGIALTAAFARRFLDSRTAILGTLLLATDPSYLIYSRTDFGPTACMMAIKGFVLWQLVRGWQTGANRPLYFAAFAAGVGVYDKANFLWVIAAILVSALMLDFLKILRRINLRAPAICALLFACGCEPLIDFNLHWPLPTLVAVQAQNAISNRLETASFAVRFTGRLRVLLSLLAGNPVPYFRDFPAPAIALVPWMLLIAAATTALFWLRRESRQQWKREAFLLLNILFIVAFAGFTPGATGAHHLILAYPFPHLLIAAVAVHCANRLRRAVRQPVAVLGYVTVAMMVLLPAGANLMRYRQIVARLQKSGGEGYWSDAIYPFADWLTMSGSHRPVVAADWGIQQQLISLSNGKLQAQEFALQTSADGFNPFLNDDAIFCLHPDQLTAFPKAKSDLMEAIAESHRSLSIIKIFNDRTGRPVLIGAEVMGSKNNSSAGRGSSSP